MDDPDRSLRTANLNLLPILRAVLKHRNLTRAAEELHVTQAAISNSLKQLRAHFGDELLRREGRSLRLTEKAKQLLQPLDNALDAIQHILGESGFEPARSRQLFRIATADYVTAITAPDMASLLAREAPSISVQMITARAGSAFHLHGDNIDLLILPRQIMQSASHDFPDMARGVTVEALASEPFVCLARKDDKAFARGLSTAEYLARPHASFHLDLNMHASLEHGYLIEHGIDQFNRLLVSNFTALPYIAATSDCIALVPLSVAREAMRSLSLRAGPPPLPIPDLELVMVWSTRRANDEALAWLRNLVRRSIAKAIPTSSKARQRPRTS